MTSTDRNKATVRAYADAFNAGDYDRIRTLFTADAKIHGVAGSGPLEFAIGFWGQLHNGLNCRLDILDICAEADTVVVWFRESGRWTGPFLGFDKPTGNSFELLAMEWFRLRDGLIAERWGVRDSASQSRQLGLPAAPAPAAKAA